MFFLCVGEGKSPQSNNATQKKKKKKVLPFKTTNGWAGASKCLSLEDG